MASDQPSPDEAKKPKAEKVGKEILEEAMSEDYCCTCVPVNRDSS